MKRSEREITDRAEIDAVIRRNTVCRLGLSDEGRPYVVPMLFGYDGACVYLHCAAEGRKLDILCRNPQVCVEFDTGETLVENEQACRWGMKYESVIAFGRAAVVRAPDRKREALAHLMAQYAGADRSFTFPDAMLARTVAIRIEIEEITGKRRE